MASHGITVRLLGDPSSEPAQAVPHSGQGYQELKRQCLEQRCLFTDPFFDAVPSSLGYWQLGLGSENIKGLEWKRPQEICRSPKFIDEDMSRTDVKQGKLGNCWFLAAAASLTLYPQLMQRVVPTGQSFAPEDYAGIFHFQFWQYGQWVDVVVDDRLPVKYGKLVFVSSCQSDEFWMPLLEKAYAKLNGSYEAMNGGYMNEAFVDFTGGIGETYQLKMPNPELFKIIRAALRKRSLMGAHIKVTQQEDMEGHTAEGLVKGHAYSITAFRKLDHRGKKLKLLRLRNPWGEVEWNGRWSDHSSLWAGLDPQLQKSLQVRKEDGEFWMQMDDFLRYFDALEICSLTPDLLEEEKGVGWNVHSFQGRWSTGYTAGGCRSSGLRDGFWMNPQYHVRLLEADEADLRKQRPDPSCTLLVSLMQKDRRQDRKRGKDFLPIGFEILKYLEQKNVSQRRALLPSLRAVYWTAHVPMRDVSGRYRLPPGDYLLIPSTGYPMEESNFTLRIFTEKANKSLEIGDEIRADMRPLQRIPNEKEFEQTFLRLAGPDKQIDAAKLQDILNKVTAKQSQIKTDGFGLERCQKIIQHFDHSKTGKLTLPEFKHLWSKIKEWEAVFIQYDVDRSGTMNIHEMQLALDAAGFHLNHQLRETITSKYRDHYLMIDFDSFLSCMVQLEAIFRQCQEYDKAGAGMITMMQKEWLELATLT
ncbi:calpain-12 isoform X1 [Malaclemys terrapin pileata]|uniref:calpain-12 isoform X1 n=1 Tax=Malaclemys terrapin pileata TaxID=2991368 RepID=UPI0023A8F1C9|nr:calpain-12 isoform X1 [Malaclemys terrapin pileata]